MMLKVSRATWVWYLRLAFAVREKDESCTLIDVPLYVYGEILPQRGKKWRKTDILFCGYIEFDSCTLQIDWIVDSYPRWIQRSEKAKEQNKKKGRIALSIFLARTCGARIPTAMLFFVVTSVTPKEEIGGKEGRNFAKCRRTKRDFCWRVKRI